MSRIIIAGAGHGGLAAAKRIAGAGHEVTVFEKNKRECCGIQQIDFFDASALEYAGYVFPEQWITQNNQLTFVPLEDDAPSLTLPRNKKDVSAAVNRGELIDFLITHAENAGVSFKFGVSIISPIILGSRVVGIKTDSGDYYADLVIDACGLNSPLRTALPDFMCIDNKPAHFDHLYSYRACFSKEQDVPDPDDYYRLFLDSDGTVGFSWVITREKDVDVLICRFDEISEEQTGDEISRLREKAPQIGKTVVFDSFSDIPVRQPLAVFVADGYAAVGDSAFMTYSLKGSGIAYSLIAGTMLASAVLNDTNGLFTAETLWEYEREFFREIGFDACRVAIVKNLLPYLTAKELSDLFKNGFITSKELQNIAENGLDSIINTKLIQLLRDKIRVLGGVPEFTSKLFDLIVWLGRFAVTEPSFPNRYSREDAEKWAAKYNELFESFRKK